MTISRRAEGSLHVRTVLVGSLPVGVSPTFVRDCLPDATHDATRPQWIPGPGRVTTAGAPMLDELVALACGDRPETDDRAVKAQLCGPLCALRTAAMERPVALGRWIDAMDTLLASTPRATELWLDEPLGGPADASERALLSHALDAVRARGHRAGIHACDAHGPSTFVDLRPDVLSFDPATAATTLTAALAARPEVEPVWGLVPTTGRTRADARRDADVVASIRALALATGATSVRISPACGLGTRSPSVARARLRALAALRAALETRLRD